VPSEDVQVLRFVSGDLSLIERLSAGNFAEIEKREKSCRARVYNSGPGLEYQFLFFNMNDPGPQPSREVLRKRTWFRLLPFRRAVSRAIDREAIRRLIYLGHADPIWGHVTPGNTVWVNRDIPHPARSLEDARALLRSASFSWKDGELRDSEGNPVGFSILVSSSNAQRGKIATIVQDDLRQLGMKVSVVSLESRTMQDRVFNRLDYDAALMALDSGDVDPNSEINVWRSGGKLHLWNLSGKAQTDWEQEIDDLMKRQMTALDQRERKRLYDRVQQLTAEHLPFICLISPHVLAGASDNLGNFQPSIVRPNALWNAESLYFREGRD
jgi:peptide/nickel transport system substrate-binding protein